MFSLIFIEKDEEIEMKEILIKPEPLPEPEPDMASFCTFL